jgi:hypothetical protein
MLYNGMLYNGMLYSGTLDNSIARHGTAHRSRPITASPATI